MVSMFNDMLGGYYKLCGCKKEGCGGRFGFNLDKLNITYFWERFGLV